MERPKFQLGRRLMLAGSFMAMTSGLARADDLSGELVVMQWQTGVDAELWQKLEAAFVAEHPGVVSRRMIWNRGPDFGAESPGSSV